MHMMQWRSDCGVGRVIFPGRKDYRCLSPLKNLETEKVGDLGPRPYHYEKEINRLSTTPQSADRQQPLRMTSRGANAGVDRWSPTF